VVLPVTSVVLQSGDALGVRQVAVSELPFAGKRDRRPYGKHNTDRDFGGPAGARNTVTDMTVELWR
jgi:hypothetical protein